MTATKPVKVECVGRCRALGRRSLGQVSCTCQRFTPGRKVDGYTLCGNPDCTHTQNVHTPEEVTA